MPTRRDFLATMSAATAGLMMPAGAWGLSDEPAADRPLLSPGEDRVGGLLPVRRFGRHDLAVTALGLGGHHVQRLDEDQHERAIERAVELGVRFFDNAASYGGGRSEELYGRYLTPKYRDIGFLMTKTTGDTADRVKQELDDSLRRMRTETVDLWQVHALQSVEDVEKRVENGVLDAFAEAREQGRARYIGFTGHTDYRAHLRMFELLEERGLAFDAVQMPVNVLDPHYDSFIEHVLPVAVERGYAVLAMKTMVFGRLYGWAPGRGNERDLAALIPDTLSFEEAAHYTWSLPISVRIAGFESVEQMEENIAACRSFVEMAEADREALLERVAFAGGRAYEHYKR